MDDQDARRASSRRLLEFIDPAAVVGHAATVELVGGRTVCRHFEIGIVDQHQDDLAAHVDALEVVPVPLGGRHAIADEHHGGLGDGDARLGPVAADDDVRSACKAHLCAAGRGGDRRRPVLQEAVDRHGLVPATVLSRRLQPQGLELPGDIGDGLVLARRRRPPSLERIAREDGDVGVEPVRLHFAEHRRGGAGGKRAEDRQDGEAMAEGHGGLTTGHGVKTLRRSGRTVDLPAASGQTGAVIQPMIPATPMAAKTTPTVAAMRALRCTKWKRLAMTSSPDLHSDTDTSVHQGSATFDHCNCRLVSRFGRSACEMMQGYGAGRRHVQRIKSA